MAETVPDRLDQAGVWLPSFLLELGLKPGMELFHAGRAVLLVKMEPLFGRQLQLSGLSIVPLHLRDTFEPVPLFLGKVRRYLHKAEPDMGIAIAQNRLELLGQFQ
jgi:hypothetical protein